MTYALIHLSPNIPAGGSALTPSVISCLPHPRHPKRLPSPSVGRGQGWRETTETNK
jgi:hypothetical protein